MELYQQFLPLQVFDRYWRNKHNKFDSTVCDKCGESEQLLRIKGCLVCQRCGFKTDCWGW